MKEGKDNISDILEENWNFQTYETTQKKCKLKPPTCLNSDFSTGKYTLW